MILDAILIVLILAVCWLAIEIRQLRKKLLVVFVLLLPTQARSQSPASEVTAAAADAAKLPPDLAKRTRYLTLYAVPKEERDEAAKALAFWCNSLSREPDIVLPRKVTDTLFAVNIDDYQWDFSTWEKLANGEPYFHQQIIVVTEELQRYGTPDGRGGFTDIHTRPTGKKTTERKTAAAPWCGQAIVPLVIATASEVPIVRGDWFLWQTGRQADREPGYYDFLGLGKKLGDFEKLVGLDRKEVARLKKEIAASVGKSSVALNNRAMYRFATITGAYWETLDFRVSTDKRNTLRLLNGDNEPPHGDAQEIYGTLPNGLFSFFLVNDKGERQDSAPDFIASDGKATDTDRRVHAGVSCVRCHAPGIQPIRDWSRTVFRDDVALGSPDYEKLKRLRQLYLSDLEGAIERDQKEYARILLTVNGMKPPENAAAFASAYSRYGEQVVDLETFANELGYSADEVRKGLRAASYWPMPGALGWQCYNLLGKQPLDQLLVGLIKEKSEPLRREHLEECFGIAATIMMGKK